MATTQASFAIRILTSVFWRIGVIAALEPGIIVAQTPQADDHVDCGTVIGVTISGEDLGKNSCLHRLTVQYPRSTELLYLLLHTDRETPINKEDHQDGDEKTHPGSGRSHYKTRGRKATASDASSGFPIKQYVTRDTKSTSRTVVWSSVQPTGPSEQTLVDAVD